MSLDSKQTIDQLKAGHRAFWGFCGPLIENGKTSASDRDININAAKSLRRKSIIEVRDGEIFLTNNSTSKPSQ